MRENRTLRLTRRGLETGLWSDTAPVLDPTLREGYGNAGIIRSPLSAITLLDFHRPQQVKTPALHRLI